MTEYVVTLAEATDVAGEDPLSFDDSADLAPPVHASRSAENLV